MKEYWQNWNIWNPEQEPLPKTVSQYKKISLCTVVFRGDHKSLSKTLLRNIADNAKYPNLEYVILGYGHNEDLNRMMRLNDFRHGKIKYYVTKNIISLSHAKNIAFKYSTGQIVCNINPDCRTGPNFADYLNLLSSLCPQRAVFASNRIYHRGRVAMHKSDFLDLGGYNEDFTGSGFEDTDLIARAMNSGFKLLQWGGIASDFCISGQTQHKDSENERKNRLSSIINLSLGRFVANQSRNFGYASDLYLFRP